MLNLTVGRVLGWYFGVVALGVFGSIASYTWFSSPAWIWWDGSGAWKKDMWRAILAAGLALFCLWNMRLFPMERVSNEDRVHVLRRPRRYEKLILGGIVAVLLVLAFLGLPEIWRRELDQLFYPRR